MENSSNQNQELTKTFKGEIWMAYDEKSKRHAHF